MANFDYGTGRRKTAIARTRLYTGSGMIEINGRPMEQYFPRKTLQMIVRQPLALTKLTEQFDIKVNVCGGGNGTLLRRISALAPYGQTRKACKGR